MSTRSATPRSPSPSSRCQNRSCSRWRWTRWVRRGSKASIGVEPSGDPFNSIRLNAENHPFNPDGQCRRDRLLRPDPRGQGRRRVRIYPAGAGAVCRARPRRRRRRLCLRKRDRRPQPRDRLSAAHQCRDQGQRGCGAGGLFPAMRHPGDGARYRRHGGHARQPRHQSRDRRAGDERLTRSRGRSPS